MAYSTSVAVVPPNQIERIREDPNAILTPNKINPVSHLLAYWIETQPLGSLLSKAIDGGQPLHADFWHPLRPPMFHGETEVASLALDLTEAWEEIEEDIPSDDWLRHEINHLLEAMRYAVDTNACLVTALGFPGGRDQRSRVRIPWLPPVKPVITQSIWQKWLARLVC